MTGGRAPRDKGNREERAVVAVLQDHGIAAERIPLSGSVGGSYTGDVTIPFRGRDLRAEVKVRAHGFAQLYEWLQGRDLLILRRNHCESLVVMPLKNWIESQ